MYIYNWNEVPDGAHVIEDTYNEVYEVFTRDGKKWLRQVGWQVNHHPVPEYERPCDFDPHCTYDQPWILLKNPEVSKKRVVNVVWETDGRSLPTPSAGMGVILRGTIEVPDHVDEPISWLESQFGWMILECTLENKEG